MWRVVIDKKPISIENTRMFQNFQPHLKNFADWFKLKPQLDSFNYSLPLVKQRDIWWVSFGQNIGSEVYGKGKDFLRPGIIFKKLSKYTFLVIPISSQIKEGSWYTKFIFNSKEMVAVLSQIRIVDYKD